jgi:hypothetical protein
MEMPAWNSGVPEGANTGSKKAGVPGFRGAPKMCNAVSHVLVNGDTTTKSNAVNDRPPDGLLAKMSFNASAC